MKRRGLTDSPAFEILVRCHSINGVVRSFAVLEGGKSVDEGAEPNAAQRCFLAVAELVSPCCLHALDAQCIFRFLGGGTAAVKQRPRQAVSNSAMNPEPPSAWTAPALIGAMLTRLSRKRAALAANRINAPAASRVGRRQNPRRGGRVSENTAGCSGSSINRI